MVVVVHSGMWLPCTPWSSNATMDEEEQKQPTPENDIEKSEQKPLDNSSSAGEVPPGNSVVPVDSSQTRFSFYSAQEHSISTPLTATNTSETQISDSSTMAKSSTPHPEDKPSFAEDSGLPKERVPGAEHLQLPYPPLSCSEAFHRNDNATGLINPFASSSLNSPLTTSVDVQQRSPNVSHAFAQPEGKARSTSLVAAAPESKTESQSGPGTMISSNSAVGGAARVAGGSQASTKASSHHHHHHHKSKQTGRWTPEEHQTFLLGLRTFGREWKKVATIIPTRSSAQVRSHAQKYFAKMQGRENQTQQQQQQQLVDDSTATLSTTDEGSANATATMMDSMASLPPSVRAQAERILAEPETVQTEVETTMELLQQRYRELQEQLQRQQQQQQQQSTSLRPGQPLDDVDDEDDDDDSESVVESAHNDEELIALHVLQGGLLSRKRPLEDVDEKENDDNNNDDESEEEEDEQDQPKRQK